MTPVDARPEAVTDPPANADVTQAEAELKRRFGSGGCIARVSEYGRVVPSYSLECLDEALHRLWKAGEVQMECLSDGALVYFFPRR